jgi:hypothetical protein
MAIYASFPSTRKQIRILVRCIQLSHFKNSSVVAINNPSEREALHSLSFTELTSSFIPHGVNASVQVKTQTMTVVATFCC